MFGLLLQYNQSDIITYSNVPITIKWELSYNGITYQCPNYCYMGTVIETVN